MKKRYGVVASVAALAMGVTLVSSGGAGAATNNGGGPLPAGLTPINILNINDFHGRIDSDGTGNLGKNFACTYLTQRTALGSNVLELAAGDLIGASPFTSAVQNDAPTIEFLNAIGLQASATGNHEFDRGFTDLTTRVQPLAKYTYLAANVYAKGTTNPVLPAYKVFEVGGIKVGVIGAVTADTPNLVAGSGVADLDFGDPVAAVNRVAGELTDGNAANGEADVLVAEYHEGGPYSSTTGTLADQLNVPVFAHLVNDTSPKVAAILQGHTHQAYVYDVQIPGAASGQTRPVLQTGLYAANVGKVQLGVDPSTKQVTAYNAENVPVTAYTPTCQADATWQAAAKVVDDAVAYAAPLAAQPIGKVTSSITRAMNNGAEDRGRESSLSNLIAQQYVDSVAQTGNYTADIGIMNPGGVRSDLLYGTDGTITFGQAAAIMPFGNTIKVGDYTGAQFKQVLEEQLQVDGSSRPYLAMGLSNNVTYTFKADAPRGSRILDVFINGKPIDPAKTYTIASNSFLITDIGAAPDGFAELLKGANYRDTGLVDQNAFMDWIKAKGTLSPSFVQHGVARSDVVDTAAHIEWVKVWIFYVPVIVPGTYSFSLSGLDNEAVGAPANTSVTVSYEGTTLATAKVTTNRVESPLPSRTGSADITVQKWTVDLVRLFAGKGKAKSTTVWLTVTAKPSGTVVKVPVTIRR